MIISVIGMGKIGLPLAVQFASKGHTVWGVDISQPTVELINAGKEPFPGEEGLSEALSDLRKTGLLRAVTSYEAAIPQSDVVVVVVPLVVDDNDRPDFGVMDSATESIGANLTPETLVIYETTLPIGTTRNRWKPMLETKSGLLEGQDFDVVFSPERVLTGRVFRDLRKYPKLIGGLSQRGTAKASDFYRSVLEFDTRTDLPKENGVWNLGPAEAAEMAKLAETTYRDVNIALANQFALHAKDIGVDIYPVIDATNSQPYSNIHQPGISVGGHCIPVYPRLYLSTDANGGVVAAARAQNARMPQHAVEDIEKGLGGLKSVRVLVLGATYRAGVKETAFSGVFPLVSQLRARGAFVWVEDPLLSSAELEALGLPPRGQDQDDFEALIFHTDHPEFRKLSELDFPNSRIVYDGRGFLDSDMWRGQTILHVGSPDESTRDVPNNS